MTLLIVVASVGAIACERSSLVRATNNLGEPVTLTVEGDSGELAPGETGIGSGPLNKAIHEISVATLDGEVVTLRFPDGGYGDFEIVIDGPPLRVTIERR